MDRCGPDARTAVGACDLSLALLLRAGGHPGDRFGSGGAATANEPVELDPPLGAVGWPGRSGGRSAPADLLGARPVGGERRGPAVLPVPTGRRPNVGPGPAVP